MKPLVAVVDCFNAYMCCQYACLGNCAILLLNDGTKGQHARFSSDSGHLYWNAATQLPSAKVEGLRQEATDSSSGLKVTSASTGSPTVGGQRSQDLFH